MNVFAFRIPFDGKNTPLQEVIYELHERRGMSWDSMEQIINKVVYKIWQNHLANDQEFCYDIVDGQPDYERFKSSLAHADVTLCANILLRCNRTKAVAAFKLKTKVPRPDYDGWLRNLLLNRNKELNPCPTQAPLLPR